MFGQAIKLGIAAAAAYAVGGQVGTMVVNKISPSASPDVQTGAIWGGRIATFVVAAYVMSKI